MKEAKLKLYWGKSPSSDVVEYDVLIVNEDTQEEMLNRTVSFAETEIVFNAPENTNITATVVAYDGVFYSEGVSVSYQVGDLTAPAPVSFAGIEVLEIVTYEDEEPVDAVEGGDLEDGLGEEVIEEDNADVVVEEEGEQSV